MKQIFLLSLIAGLGLLAASSVTAQTFTNLYNFTALTGANSDGAGPSSGLILSGNTLYGTASGGGIGGNGTIFSVNANGSNFTTLHNFNTFSNTFSDGEVNSDGADPQAGLVLSGNTLYGTTSEGGNGGSGTIFSVNTNGSNFMTLHNFTTLNLDSNNYNISTNSDGAYPQARLILSGSTLYGTAIYGGIWGSGTIFSVNTNGSNFTTLHIFTAVNYTNSDGEEPWGGLILSGNTLYGTALYGGSSGYGTVFAINTNGANFTTLHNFTALTRNGGFYTNSDGAYPYAGLILSGSTLYGTASQGGIGGYGTIFSVNTNGSNFMTLHNFTALTWNGVSNTYTNNDGAKPQNGLILSGSTLLYGTASEGGIWNSGTIFSVNTNGSNFITLYDFTGGYIPDPDTDLILSDNTLYGTGDDDGSNGSGLVFSLSLPVPSLGITPSGNQIILSWPTWAPNFSLQTTTNLASSTWSAVFPAPVTVNGQNTVTNSMSGTQQFYRLISD